MRAVVFDDVGRVRVDDVAEPAIEEPGDAVMRVTRSAICGSDLHFFHGKAPMSPGEGIGHEAVGVVEAHGREAYVAPGQFERSEVHAGSIACRRPTAGRIPTRVPRRMGRDSSAGIAIYGSRFERRNAVRR